MSKLRGLILDIDGTLVDSNDAHAHAWVEALAEHGVSVPFDTVRPLIGMGGDKLLPRVAGFGEETPRGEAVSKRRREIFKSKYLPQLKPTPGAAELLQKLKEAGLKLVVATSAKADEADRLLQICGGHGLIESKTSSDDAENSKPDPDIVMAALQESGLPVDEVLMLGDTPYDIEAATQAGLRTIAVRCGGWTDDKLAGALAVYDHPADLLQHLDQMLLQA